MLAAAALARRRALAALLQQASAAPARGFALHRRPARRPAADSKALAPVPAGWQPVQDKVTGGTYFWNERTGQTTAVGAPRPEGEYLPAQYEAPAPTTAAGAARGVAGLVAWGAGITFAFAGVRALFG